MDRDFLAAGAAESASGVATELTLTDLRPYGRAEF
jgi:hypothetical protein